MKPDIITFLAPKGGAGRTTAVMALASTIVEKKGFAPLVIDATPEARLRLARDTTLGQWQQQMYRSGVKRYFFSVYQATAPDELTTILSKHRQQLFPDFGTILIDTGGRLDDLALTAIGHSDLLITPFMDALTALRVSEALDGVDLAGTPLYGLKCGDACNEADHRAISAAFTAGRLFIHGLPSSLQLENISVDGHLFTTLTRLSQEYAQHGLADPASTPVRDFIKVKSEINQLFDEIRLALNGYELRKRTLRPRRRPLPLHKLAELLPT